MLLASLQPPESARSPEPLRSLELLERLGMPRSLGASGLVRSLEWSGLPGLLEPMRHLRSPGPQASPGSLDEPRSLEPLHPCRRGLTSPPPCRFAAHQEKNTNNVRRDWATARRWVRAAPRVGAFPHGEFGRGRGCVAHGHRNEPPVLVEREFNVIGFRVNPPRRRCERTMEKPPPRPQQPQAESGSRSIQDISHD